MLAAEALAWAARDMHLDLDQRGSQHHLLYIHRITRAAPGVGIAGGSRGRERWELGEAT